MFTIVYLTTGICGSLASYWFNKGVLSAGASGAIFGLFGVFIALLLSNMIEAKKRAELLKSVGVILVINLGLGLILPVDNAAHIGGLLSGTIIGTLLLPLMREKRRKMLNENHPPR